MNKPSRRTFIKGVAGSGLLATSALFGFSDLNDEAQKKKHAKYLFKFSSPYASKDFLFTPHVHQEIKSCIEKYTRNEVYVEIIDNGLDGIGSPIANLVKFGRSQGGLLSVSNFSAKVPEIDLVNIPYWCSEDAAFIRLFDSKPWRKHVLTKVEAHQITILFPYLTGARTATTIKSFQQDGGSMRAPEDFKGIHYRVPNSKVLHKFYELAGARPYFIPWGLCARNARRGRFQALDPGVIGLYSGPDNLRNEIAVITELELVPDAWVAIANTDFINSLPVRIRHPFLEAMQEIRARQLQHYQRSKALCSKGFKQLGVPIIKLTEAEKSVFASQYGHQNPAWNSYKKELLGKNGIQTFEALYKAAQG